MKPDSENSRQAQAAARRRRRRRRRVLRAAVLLTALLLLLLIVGLVVLHITGTVAKNNGTPASFMAVREIVVEGETRYSAEDIIRESGIYVGESLLVVNKVQAHNRLLEAFPYLDYVDVGNTSFSTVCIRVRETAVLGAVRTEDGYLMLGANNHALELVSGAALPEGTVRILGATLQGTQLGGSLLDERSLRITTALLDAAAACGLTDLRVIDITEKTNIRLVWRDQLVVLLGNETNLAQQIRALQALLPTLLQNNGEGILGQLDMTSYADDNADNDKAIFSPADRLPEEYALPADEPTEPAEPAASAVPESTPGTEGTAAPETAGQPLTGE